MLKKAQIIMLPTGSNLEFPYIAQNVFNKQLTIVNSTFAINCELQSQHLYIISDDEIKEGDWFIYANLMIIKCIKTNNDNQLIDNQNVWYSKFNSKKIIATTDASLKRTISNMIGIGIIDTLESLPQPSQQFITKYIEAYNKGEVITDVLVEYEYYHNKQSCFKTVCYQQDMEARDSCMGMCEDIKLKVNYKDNNITIKKLKDSWNREEVISAMIWAETNGKHYVGTDKEGRLKQFNEWINKNL